MTADKSSEVLTISDVYIGSCGVVFNSNKQVLYTHHCHTPKIEQYDFDDANVINLKGEYLYMLTRWDRHVWGHIREDLRRLQYFTHSRFKKCTLLKNKSGIRSWWSRNNKVSLTKHLECFGYEEERQLELNKLTGFPNTSLLYRVETLHIHPHSKPFDLEAASLKFIRDTWIKPLHIQEPSSRHEKIYVVRPNGRRSVTNQDDVIKYMIGQGFYIFTGKESFEEQVRLFRDAKVIVGAHGAAFFNTIFCANKPIIMEFMPDNRFVNMYKTQSINLGNPNHKIFSIPAMQDNSITIDINTISDHLGTPKPDNKPVNKTTATPLPLNVAIIYHGVLRWPGGIHTQLKQLERHNVDLYFCLQQDKDSQQIIDQFNYQRSFIYERPSLDWFYSTFELDKLLSGIPNSNWLSYAPHINKSYSLLNYHNFFQIAEQFEDQYKKYDLVIIARSDLRALFPFNFNDFDKNSLYISDGFNHGGYQLIGNWIYASPEVISRTLRAVYTTLFDTDYILEKHPWADKYNVEAYCKFALDRHEINVKHYPLNCYISADSLKEEQSGYGWLSQPAGYEHIIKWKDQFKVADDNLQRYLGEN